MKRIVDMNQHYVYFREGMEAEPSEIWECNGIFYYIGSRGVKCDEGFRYNIYQIYPVVIHSDPDEIENDAVFTFVCRATELEKFLKDIYILKLL